MLANCALLPGLDFRDYTGLSAKATFQAKFLPSTGCYMISQQHHSYPQQLIPLAPMNFSTEPSGAVISCLLDSSKWPVLLNRSASNTISANVQNMVNFGSPNQHPEPKVVEEAPRGQKHRPVCKSWNTSWGGKQEKVERARITQPQFSRFERILLSNISSRLHSQMRCLTM